jgi:hypothetical protein
MRAPYVLLGLFSLEFVEAHITVDASVFASTDEIKHLVHKFAKTVSASRAQKKTEG